MRAAPEGGVRAAVDGRRVGTGHRALDDFTYSVVEAPAHRAPGERRLQRRVPTRLHDGLIADRPGGSIVDCRIRDQSHRGARILLDKHRALPRTFVLTDVAARKQVHVALIWQIGRNAGVRYLCRTSQR